MNREELQDELVEPKQWQLSTVREDPSGAQETKEEPDKVSCFDRSAEAEDAKVSPSWNVGVVHHT